MTLTESQAERVVGAFAAGADWALAARILSIPMSTVRRAIEADASLLERVEDARAQADEVVIKSLYTKATVDKDVTAMIFWLKNRRPQQWRDRKELEVAVGDIAGALRKAADRARERKRLLCEAILAEVVDDEKDNGHGRMVPFVPGGNGGNGHE
jgi:hypothetical protein